MDSIVQYVYIRTLKTHFLSLCMFPLVRALRGRSDDRVQTDEDPREAPAQQAERDHHAALGHKRHNEDDEQVQAWNSRVRKCIDVLICIINSYIMYVL